MVEVSRKSITWIPFSEALRLIGEAYGSPAYAKSWVIEHLARGLIRWRCRAMRPPDQSVENFWRSGGLVVDEEGAATIPYVMTGVDAVAIGRLTLFGVELVREDLAALAGEPASSSLGVELYKTGGPGRPSARHLVEEEAKRRIKDGEVTVELGGLGAFCRKLEDWWKDARLETTPPGPPLSAVTIENHVRSIWNAALPGIPEP